MPERRVPRAFSLPWGQGQIIEEAGIEGGQHAPSVQLLHYERGEKQGQHAIRFAAFDGEGRLEQRPLIINEREIARLRKEINLAPRLKALLKQLVEE